MTINQRIKVLRKEQKLNQSEFGAKIGLKQSAASKLEQDGATVIDQNVRLICEAFGVSEHWLRTGEGPKEAKKEDNWLAKLADQYRLSGAHAGLIDAWLHLEPDQREHFLEAARALVAGADAGQAAEEAYRAPKHAELDEAPDLQKKESSSSSPTSAAEKRA